MNVTTHDPERRFQLDISPEGVAVSPGAHGELPAGSAVLRLPAEAFVRLVYGLLDHEHMTSVETENADLGLLRRVFPGLESPLPGVPARRVVGEVAGLLQVHRILRPVLARWPARRYRGRRWPRNSLIHKYASMPCRARLQLFGACRAPGRADCTTAGAIGPV